MVYDIFTRSNWLAGSLQRVFNGTEGLDAQVRDLTFTGGAMQLAGCYISGSSKHLSLNEKYSSTQDYY